MLGYQKAAAAAAWAAAEVLMLLGAAVHASPAGWPLDHFATGARYGEGDAGYGQSFSKGFGISFGHGLYGDGFDGNRLPNYGAGYGYGGNYGYGGSYKDWLEEWPGSFFEGFPFRKNAAPAKFSKADSNFDFLGEPKYNIGWGSNDYLPGDKLSHNEFSDGEKVVGTYSLKEPGGHVRTVTYFADDSGGFQASVNSDGDFNGAAYGFEYGDGSAGLESALPPSWSGWAKGGGGDGGGGSSWPGHWGAYGVGPLPAGYALQDTS